MKSASSAWRIKQMRYSPADNRADNPKHHCPCDRQMRMHQRFRDTAGEEPDNDIPDKMKHDFLLRIVQIWKSNPAPLSDWPVESHAKLFAFRRRRHALC